MIILESIDGMEDLSSIIESFDFFFKICFTNSGSFNAENTRIPSNDLSLTKKR
jgi:hypothetical protein